LLVNGIGGGASPASALEASLGFLLGGGGGAFLKDTILSLTWIWELVGASTEDCAVARKGALARYCPAFSVRLYLVFNLFADFQPEATWSPWRSLKLLAVETAFRASDNETEDGSLRNDCAVLNAACFSAIVVPWLGASAGAEDLPRPENLDCNSFSWGELGIPTDVTDGIRGGGPTVAGLDADAVEFIGGAATGCFPPIPNPGTDIPAAPNLLNEPWFKIPLWEEGPVVSVW